MVVIIINIPATGTLISLLFLKATSPPKKVHHAKRHIAISTDQLMGKPMYRVDAAMNTNTTMNIKKTLMIKVSHLQIYSYIFFIIRTVRKAQPPFRPLPLKGGGRACLPVGRGGGEEGLDDTPFLILSTFIKNFFLYISNFQNLISFFSSL